MVSKTLPSGWGHLGIEGNRGPNTDPWARKHLEVSGGAGSKGKNGESDV